MLDYSAKPMNGLKENVQSVVLIEVHHIAHDAPDWLPSRRSAPPAAMDYLIRGRRAVIRGRLAEYGMRALIQMQNGTYYSVYPFAVAAREVLYPKPAL